MFGDKVKARTQAQLAQIPVIPGSDGPVDSLEEVEEFAEKYDYPIIIKASLAVAVVVCVLYVLVKN